MNKNEIVKADVSKVGDEELLMHLDNLGLTKDLTVGEKNSYLQIAKAFNLNPFKREIHVSKYNGQMSIITGYETYIKRAERTGLLDGWSVVTTGSVEKNDLKAILTIYRKDRSHPFVWEAEYKEFVQVIYDKDTKERRPTKFWQKGSMMIKKVAISQGFRLCFSDELGGMPYTADEMPDPKTEDISHEVVSQPELVKVVGTPLNMDQLISDGIDMLRACGNLETLANAYKSLTPDLKKALVKVKDECKEVLTAAAKLSVA